MVQLWEYWNANGVVSGAAEPKAFETRIYSRYSIAINGTMPSGNPST